jgi:hypothetical protein
MMTVVQAQAPHVRMWAACMHLDYAQVGAVFAQKGQPVDKDKQAKADLVSTVLTFCACMLRSLLSDLLASS